MDPLTNLQKLESGLSGIKNELSMYKERTHQLESHLEMITTALRKQLDSKRMNRKFILKSVQICEAALHDQSYRVNEVLTEYGYTAKVLDGSSKSEEK